jgi:hypothetical protein
MARVPLNLLDWGDDLNVDITSVEQLAQAAYNLATGLGITPTYASALAGATFTLYYTEGSGWPPRPTDRTDLIFVWTGGDENHPPTAAAVGVDKWDRPVS